LVGAGVLGIVAGWAYVTAFRRPVRGSAWFALFALSTVVQPGAATIGFIGVFVARFGAALDLLVSRLTPPGPAEFRRASWSTTVFVAVVAMFFFYVSRIK